jgi:hypothetical protein
MRNSQIDIELKKKYVYLAYKWCVNFFGENPRKKTELHIDINHKKRKIKRTIYYGKYCFYKNKLTIYINNCDTLLSIVQTVIHEYTHYLQIRRKSEYYHKTYSYYANPYEKEAAYNEKKYGKKCLMKINNQFKISNSTTSLKKNNKSFS